MVLLGMRVDFEHCCILRTSSLFCWHWHDVFGADNRRMHLPMSFCIMLLNSSLASTTTYLSGRHFSFSVHVFFHTKACCSSRIMLF